MSWAGGDGDIALAGGAGGLNSSCIALCRWNFINPAGIKGSAGPGLETFCSDWLDGSCALFLFCAAGGGFE